MNMDVNIITDVRYMITFLSPSSWEYRSFGM